MSEELLTAEELQDRCWAIVAAAAEDRTGDVDELLVTLPWEDLVTVVCAIAGMAARTMAGHLEGDDARARVADLARALIVQRRTEREGPAGDAT